MESFGESSFVNTDMARQGDTDLGIFRDTQRLNETPREQLRAAKTKIILSEPPSERDTGSEIPKKRRKRHARIYG